MDAPSGPMSKAEEKAHEIIKKADAKLKSMLSSFFGGNKYEDAEELYKQAANQFKAAKCCALPPAACHVAGAHARTPLPRPQAAMVPYVCRAGRDAGAAFEKAAECHLKLKSPHEMATAYQEAAVCYRKTDTNAAVRCYKQTSEVRSRRHRLWRQVLAFPATRAVVAHSTGPSGRSTPPSARARARSHSRARLLAHVAIAHRAADPHRAGALHLRS